LAVKIHTQLALAILETFHFCHLKLFTKHYQEVLIVGIYNTVDRTNEYTYSSDPTYGGGDGDIYLDFIQSKLLLFSSPLIYLTLSVCSVLPYVNDHYRVELQQPNLGILGSSLGGLISCYAGWTRSSVYSKVSH
jgi:hypothetical protein